MHLAALPQTIANLSKGLGKTVKGVDKEFVAAIVHELVGDEQLFVYPPAKKNAGERYGVCPPPPAPLPWQQPKNRKAFDKILADVRKLMEAAQLGPAELIELLRKHLGSPEIQNRNLITERVSPHSSPFVELENLILKAVANATIVSLPELRGSMPSEYRGRAFDEAVLRLAGDDRILVYKDAEDSSFSEAERPGYVQDGSHIYTSIAKRGE
jgi:hypothetical protein